MTEPRRPFELVITDTRRWLSGFAASLPMLVITDHPTDWPDYYVARLWLTLPQPHVTSFAIMDSDLDRLREIMRALGGVCTAPSPGDDPIIVETWVM